MKNLITIRGIINGKFHENEDGSVKILETIDTMKPFEKDNLIVFSINRKLYKTKKELISSNKELTINGEISVRLNSKGITFILMNVLNINSMNKRLLKTLNEIERERKKEDIFIEGQIYENVSYEKWYDLINESEFEIINSKDIILVESIHKNAEINLSNIYNRNPIKPLAVRKLENGKYGLVCGLRSYLKIRIFNSYKAKVFITNLCHDDFILKYKYTKNKSIIEKNKIRYNKRIAKMLEIYLDRTGLEWEDIKYLILKNKDVITFFDEGFIKYSNIKLAAHNLIALTLSKDLREIEWEAKIDLGIREKTLLDLMRSSRIEFLIDENFLEKFYPYTKYFKELTKY